MARKYEKPPIAVVEDLYRQNWPCSMIAAALNTSKAYVTRYTSHLPERAASEVATFVLGSPNARRLVVEAYNQRGVRGAARRMELPDDVARECVYRAIKSDDPPGPWKASAPSSPPRRAPAKKKKAAPKKKAPAKKKAARHG